MQTRSTISNIAIFIVVAFLLLRTFHVKKPQTDAAQIEDQLQAAALAANDKDEHDVMSIFSDNYGDDDNDDWTRMDYLMLQGMSHASSITVVVSPPTISISGDTAQSTCNISITADGQLMVGKVLRLVWHKESILRDFIFQDSVWRITHSNYAHWIT